MTDRKEMTIFHAYQSFYYKTIAEIIGEILAGKITQNNLIEEIGNRGFQDISDTRGNRVNTTVSDGFQRGKWFLTVVDPSTKQYETVLLHKPTIPPSLMERRWLKAVLNDPRVQLFDLDRSRLDEWLADVDPLFTEEDIVFFDQFNNGDPYEDATYQACFRSLMQAIRKKTPISFDYRKGDGKRKHIPYCMPEHLEYSAKNDKFRLRTSGCSYVTDVNVSDMYNVSPATDPPSHRRSAAQKKAETQAVYQTLDNVIRNNREGRSLATVTFSYSLVVKEPCEPYVVIKEGKEKKVKTFVFSRRQITLSRCIPECFVNGEKAVKVRCQDGEIRTVRIAEIPYGSLEVHRRGRGSGMLKALPLPQRKTVLLRVSENRDALERFRQTFSYCIREYEGKEKDGENWHRIRLQYDEVDEKEIITNVLSFGPYIEVLAPETFRQSIIDKLIAQRRWNLKVTKTVKEDKDRGKKETNGS